jgi:5'-3' exonuclease
VIALIDGDMLCYRIGFACDSETEEVATSTMYNFIADIMMELDEVDEVEVFLSGKTNFRNDVAVTVPYKGNRAGNRKPQHHQALRDYLVNDWGADVSVDEEADDTITIRATELGDEAIIVSLDKDFDQVVGWHYNFSKDKLYYIEQDEGDLNFYMQFLMGDRIDNIIGVKGIGCVKAAKLLEDKTPRQMWEVCVEHLGEERALENGRLLYLRRKANELWCPPEEEQETTSDEAQQEERTEGI